jgi:macrolide phosphotransferase
VTPDGFATGGTNASSQIERDRRRRIHTWPMIEKLLAAARAAGLQPAAGDAAIDESGADFLVLHAIDGRGDRWIARAPRRSDVLGRAAGEKRILELVRSRVPVAVPEWRVYSEELIAYPRLAGAPAATVDMARGGYVWRFEANSPPADFLSTLARALAALHGIDQAAAAEAGVRVMDPAAERQAHADRMNRARDLLPVRESVWRQWQDWLDDDSYWPPHSVFLHGDLHPPHILVDDEHRVIGLLDWTEAHVGDPATDFAILYATIGKSPLRSLLNEYAAAGGRTWPRMPEHIALSWSAYPGVLADFAVQSGEEFPLQLARQLLEESARGLSDGK